MTETTMSTGAENPSTPSSEPTTQANFNTPDYVPEAPKTKTEAPKQTEPKQAPAPEAPVKDEYTPNFKFKVVDKELEFDDFIKGVIKDPDTEKKAKELYEKAYGLDFIKPKYQEVREKYKQLETQHNAINTQISELQEVYSRGDFDSFFKKLAIPQEKVLQWVLEKARLQEMSPEQRQLIEAKKQAENQAWEAQKQNKELQAYTQKQVVQAKAYALNLSLERPDIKAYAQAFDARAGKPGAFKEEIINRGELAWYTRGEDISPEQAIQEVIQFAGLSQPHQAAPQPYQAPASAPAYGTQAPENSQPKAAKRPPTIPNVGGQTSSPMKPKYTSLEQLKKRYNEIRS